MPAYLIVFVSRPELESSPLLSIIDSDTALKIESLPLTQGTHTCGLWAPQVLGTFIAEHDTGRQVCDSAFASPEAAERTASQLAAVAAAGAFEGWLINLEVPLSPKLVPHILSFLRCPLPTPNYPAGVDAERAHPATLPIWIDSLTFLQLQSASKQAELLSGSTKQNVLLSMHASTDCSSARTKRCGRGPHPRLVNQCS